MNHPSCYQSASNVQRRDAKRILEEFAKVIQWRSDGRDRLIDIGSGSGNVVIDYIYPLMPADFEELIGCDVSAKMISYANEKYAGHVNTKFLVLDICSDILPSQLRGHFDHVTSFYCLHWVQNQQKALENIYQLLRTDSGDCLLVFLATNQIFDIYASLAKITKWSRHMQDYKKYVSPLHHSSDPGTEFGHLLQQAGFTHYNVEVRSEIYFYEGVRSVKDNVKAVCPFLDRIPTELHDEFLDDFVNTMAHMDLRQSIEDSDDYRFISSYKLVVAYARKSDGVVNMISAENRPKNCNAMQRHDAKRYLEEYVKVIRWRNDGRDRLIDIGCGPADVLMDIVHPTLPPVFKELIGVDINPNMVEFAKKACADDERVQFEVVDIGNKMLPTHLIGRFDHVTSFYCIHWVQAQQTALENIYKLLRSDGGDGLIVSVITHPSYDIYITLSKNPKWSQYMQGIKEFTPPLKFSSDPGAEFEKLCRRAGFSHYDIKVREELYFYESTMSFRNNMKAAGPYLDPIPDELHEEFMDDFINIAVQMKLQEKIGNSDNYRYRMDYKVLTAYVRKSNTNNSSYSAKRY